MYHAGNLPANDLAEWDRFVASHPDGHFLQGSGWGNLRADQGWRVQRIAVRDGSGAMVAGAQVLARRSPLGPVAYVPRGPVCRPGHPAWSTLLDAVASAGGRHAVAVRLEPGWPDSLEVRAWLMDQGLRPSEAVQPPTTVLVDLAPAEATLLAGMKQKWRYNIRLAERHGVRVRLGAAEDLPLLGELMAATARRDAFHARPAGYYAAVWHALQPHSRLYLAEWSGRALAASLVVHHGPAATYLYGASSDHERQRMPNHLLQWEAMRRAKAEGLLRYDFWGVPDALGVAAGQGRDPDSVPVGRDGLWGVWGFKRGFGGTVWRAVGSWDMILAPRRYAVARWALAARRRGPGAG